MISISGLFSSIFPKKPVVDNVYEKAAKKLGIDHGRWIKAYVRCHPELEIQEAINAANDHLLEIERAASEEANNPGNYYDTVCRAYFDILQDPQCANSLRNLVHCRNNKQPAAS